MTSSFNRNSPNYDQGKCKLLRRLKGLHHDEYRFVHENNVGHTYPTMRCNFCKEEWDLTDEQMKPFIEEERIEQEKWAKVHECTKCGQPHMGSYFNSCEEWKKAGEQIRGQLGI